MNKLLTVVGLVAGIALSATASATIIGGSVTGGSAYGQGGEFVLEHPTAGYNVGHNNHQSPDLFAFNEDQNIVLGADLAIDIGGVSISAGEEVSSHYIFFDPAGGTTVQGWVDFDAEILGVIAQTDKLEDSDFLGNDDVNYLNPNLRGLEFGQDAVYVDDNRLYIAQFWASSPGDYIRVLTSSATSVPEPATAALFLLGLLGMSKKWKFATAKA